MENKSEIIFQPFQGKDQGEVKQLILAGLAEHWEKLDASLNKDLDDIADSYCDAIFLVARHGRRIVASGALRPAGEESGQIVRMSVVSDMRRQGLGRLMLAELTRRGRELGYRRIVLETTETWQDVIKFYMDFGFLITNHQDGDIYFVMELD